MELLLAVLLVQERGCGDVNDLTFTLTCSTASGDQRAERPYTTYTGGSRQFEGYFRITSQTGTRISLKQTFHETGSGPYFMLAVERGGRLYVVHGGTTLATGATVGTTVRVNTVHDMGGTRRTYPWLAQAHGPERDRRLLRQVRRLPHEQRRRADLGGVEWHRFWCK